MFRCSFPLSRGVLKRKKGLDSRQRRPQLRGDVDENHHVGQSPQYLQSSPDLVSRKRSGDVSPNTNLNLSQELVTKLARHETLDLFDKCPEMDSVLFIKIPHWNSRAGDRFSRSRILETCGSGTIVCNPTSDCA